MEHQLDSTLYSKEVIEFVTVANETCSFLEQCDSLEVSDFMGKLMKILPLLYLKASLLPTVEPNFEDGNEKFVSEGDWFFIKNKVQKLTGRFDQYPDIFDPNQPVEYEEKVSSISENLSDIYQDIKDFLMLYRISTDEIMNDAVWEVKMNFDRYWGQHLVNALRAVHYLVHHNSEYADNMTDNFADFNEEESIQRNISDNWIISKRQRDYQEDEDEKENDLDLY